MTTGISEGDEVTIKDHDEIEDDTEAVVTGVYEELGPNYNNIRVKYEVEEEEMNGRVREENIR